MKYKELQGRNLKQLIKLKKDLELDSIKASTVWGLEKTKNKEAGINAKGVAKAGQKTSMQKQLRITISTNSSN